MSNAFATTWKRTCKHIRPKLRFIYRARQTHPRIQPPNTRPTNIHPFTLLSRYHYHVLQFLILLIISLLFINISFSKFISSFSNLYIFIIPYFLLHIPFYDVGYADNIIRRIECMEAVDCTESQLASRDKELQRSNNGLIYCLCFCGLLWPSYSQWPKVWSTTLSLSNSTPIHIRLVSFQDDATQASNT